MASWEWIALGLAFLALLQLVALQYARRMSSDDEGPSVHPTAGAAPEAKSERPAADATGDEVVCRHCGTPNDPTYTYCRECVAQLG